MFLAVSPPVLIPFHILPYIECSSSCDTPRCFGRVECDEREAAEGKSSEGRKRGVAIVAAAKKDDDAPLNHLSLLFHLFSAQFELTSAIDSSQHHHRAIRQSDHCHSSSSQQQRGEGERGLKG